MIKAFRVEIIVANVVLQKTLEIMDNIGLNYTVFKDIAGRGERGSKSAENVLTVLSCTYILSVCSQEKASRLTDSVSELLEIYGGTYFITETMAWEKTGL